MEIFGVSLPGLLSQLLLGLVNGSFYAILSLGLAVIFGLLNIINFAHGALYMMGAFVAQDGRNVSPPENQNFKLVPWDRVAKALGLKVSYEVGELRFVSDLATLPPDLASAPVEFTYSYTVRGQKITSTASSSIAVGAILNSMK